MARIIVHNHLPRRTKDAPVGAKEIVATYKHYRENWGDIHSEAVGQTAQRLRLSVSAVREALVAAKVDTKNTPVGERTGIRRRM